MASNTSLALVPSYVFGGALSQSDDYDENGNPIFDRNAELNLPESVRTQLKTQAQLYPSRPLNSAGDETRLLHILPGDWDDEVRCELEIAALVSNPEYEILSYTWGTSSEGRKIKLDAIQQFPVTNNAFSALRRLRLRKDTRVIWIDAICINQGYFAERLQQVSMMGEIYKRAKKCLVWLGHVPNTPKEVLTLEGEAARPRDGSDEHRMLEALDHIFWNSKPQWWERAWIVQETVLSTKLDVCFACFQIPWGDFCWDFLRVDSMEQTPKTGMAAYPMHLRSSREFPIRKPMRERFESLNSMRSRFTTEVDHDPLRVVVTNMLEAECADSRDKIYSVLSIIDPAEAKLIVADYNRPWAEVFARASYAAIAVQKEFSLLHMLNFHYRGTNGLPSWALDFTKASNFERQRFSTIGPAEWFGWRHSLGPHATVVELSTNASELTVRGAKLDTIVTKTLVLERPLNTASVNLCEALAAGVDTARTRRTLDLLVQPQSTHLSAENVPSLQFGERLEALRAGKLSYTAYTGRLIAQDSVNDNIVAAFNLWSRAAGVPATIHERVAGWAEFDVSKYWDYALASAGDAMFCTTASGFLTLTPKNVFEGDVVALLEGSKLPVLLRPNGSLYTFEGFVYVHGIMYDELKTLGLSESLVGENFVLC